jgi:hypothetical protein
MSSPTSIVSVDGLLQVDPRRFCSDENLDNNLEERYMNESVDYVFISKADKTTPGLATPKEQNINLLSVANGTEKNAMDKIEATLGQSQPGLDPNARSWKQWVQNEASSVAQKTADLLRDPEVDAGIAVLAAGAIAFASRGKLAESVEKLLPRVSGLLKDLAECEAPSKSAIEQLPNVVPTSVTKIGFPLREGVATEPGWMLRMTKAANDNEPIETVEAVSDLRLRTNGAMGESTGDLEPIAAVLRSLSPEQRNATTTLLMGLSPDKRAEATAIIELAKNGPIDR